MSNEKWLLRNRKVDLKAMSEKYKISQLLCKLMVNRDIIDENITNSIFVISLFWISLKKPGVNEWHSGFFNEGSSPHVFFSTLKLFP